MCLFHQTILAHRQVLGQWAPPRAPSVAATTILSAFVQYSESGRRDLGLAPRTGLIPSQQFSKGDKQGKKKKKGEHQGPTTSHCEIPTTPVRKHWPGAKATLLGAGCVVSPSDRMRTGKVCAPARTAGFTHAGPCLPPGPGDPGAHGLSFLRLPALPSCPSRSSGTEKALATFLLSIAGHLG